MQDRVPLYPGRVKLTPVSGQENTYDMARADEPTQGGTPLNKATLLKDATAAKLGLGVDAVPDDAFSVLSTLAGKNTSRFCVERIIKSTDWTVPKAVMQLFKVFAVGGGGGGGYYTEKNGGGGGGGGYVEIAELTIPAGEVISVVCGAGGVPSNSNDADGNLVGSTGGTTYFGSYLSAAGGKGGRYGNGSQKSDGGDGGAGGGGGNTSSNTYNGNGGNGGTYGGGGGAYQARKGGNGGKYGGGGGAHSGGTPGTGGEYGGNGGAEIFSGAGTIAAFSLADTLLKPMSVDGNAGFNRSGGSSDLRYGGGGGYGGNGGNGQYYSYYGGGGGGGFGGDGGDGCYGGGGGGNYGGNGGNGGKDSNCYGGGGGGGLFCDGGSANSSSGGGGGGIVSGSSNGYGGSGGVYIMYYKED